MLIDHMKAKIVQLGYSYATLRIYVHWVRQFLVFHRSKDEFGDWQWRHPNDMNEMDVEAFLTHLAVNRHVSPTTQNQALQAILFLYKRLLDRQLVNIQALRAKRPKRVPEILAVEEVQSLLEHLRGTPLLMASLLYGCGLRLRECLSLRVKDIDLHRKQIAVRGGKGQKDRFVPLPQHIAADLELQISKAEAWCKFDNAKGNFGVSMPYALARKSPRAARSVAWYFLFCSETLSNDPLRPGSPLMRHHIHPDGIAKAVRRATSAAKIRKRVTPHLLRHAFASHLIETGTDIRVLKELMGHNSIETTQVYLHVRTNGPSSVCSPLDRLPATRPAEKAVA